MGVGHGPLDGHLTLSIHCSPDLRALNRFFMLEKKKSWNKCFRRNPEKENKMPASIPGQANSPNEPFGGATTDNGGNFADFSAFEVNIIYSCFIANCFQLNNKGSCVLDLTKTTTNISITSLTLSFPCCSKV